MPRAVPPAVPQAVPPAAMPDLPITIYEITAGDVVVHVALPQPRTQSQLTTSSYVDDDYVDDCLYATLMIVFTLRR